jgi:hypothetical protein
VVTPNTCTVLFTEEKGRRSRLYDFTKLPVAGDVQRWMARCFARATGPRGGAKRLNTANSYYRLFAHLARVLASAQRPPATAGQITPAHIAAFRLSLTPASLNNSIHRLRTLVRQDDELPAETRRDICAGRLPRRPVAKVLAYTEQERQQILVAARADIRKARDRIRGARELLGRYRRGEVAGLDQRERRTAQALDVLDRTGDLPRQVCGAVPDWAQDIGGARGLLPMLCLTRMEAAAFAVLLVDMTGENFGTIIDWPAAHFRPDGGLGGQAVALVEETKPRRGPYREHMIAALEDLPGEMADVLADDGERRLFRSPLRAYSLLLDLTSLARRHGGFDVAFAYVAISGAAKWRAGMNSYYVGRWAEDHGFPQPPSNRPDRPGKPKPAPADTSKPPVLLLRLRQTAIERGRRPIAHTRDTMNDHYLRRSPQVVRESQDIVREALNDEIAKARSVQCIPVFTPGFLARAGTDPAGAAAEMGLDTMTLKRIIAREQDTVLASCTNHLSSPHDHPGDPCSASFLACLGCPNARALPHQLPVQVVVHDHLKTLRADLPPRAWEHRFGEAFSRLTSLLGHYTPEDRAAARDRVAPEDRHLADDLLSGRLDLR